MNDKTAQIRLLVILATIVLLAGCRNDEKKKALAEAAQAKAEVVKLKADTVALKGEVSFLKERLRTTNKARDKFQKQSDELIEDKEAVTTDAQDALQENDKLKAILAEQTKKTDELKKQVEQLKAVIRELQKKIEPNKPPEQPKAAADTNQ
jgi:chromosome segregation ATPase